MKRLTLFFIVVLFCQSSHILAQQACPVGVTLPSRLSGGMEAQVTAGLANNVRVLPSRSAEKIGEITGGTLVTVLDGPICADDFNWIQIQAGDLIGWTVESVESMYALERITPSSFSQDGIAFDVPFVDQFDGDQPQLERIVASNITPDALRIADEFTGIFELSLMSAAQIKRRQPGIVQFLEEALFSDVSDDWQHLLSANALNPASEFYRFGELNLELRRDMQVIEVETGRFYRFVTPFRDTLAYVAYGLLHDGEILVSHFTLLPYKYISSSSPFNLDEQLADLNNISRRAIAPYLQQADQTLQSLVVSPDTLQEVTDAALATPELTVCGKYPPRLWLEEEAQSEFGLDAVRIRDAAGGAVTGNQIPPFGFVKVLEGPVCVNEVNWWRIESTEIPAVGWIAESNQNGYLVSPVKTFVESTDEP